MRGSKKTIIDNENEDEPERTRMGPWGSIMPSAERQWRSPKLPWQADVSQVIQEEDQDFFFLDIIKCQSERVV
jgi:hypothetical protein